MGLASSQARLLSLTSRQHTIEANAQRLLSDKMRLSNNSDASYQKYMNALEETALKTRQTSYLGETSWIDGSIYNLMRYNAPENTTGSIFFVQDLENGQLYIPQDILNRYNDYTAATIPAGHEYTDAMKFATLFGIEYKKVDRNEDILIKYNSAIAKGWQNSLTPEQYSEYTTEVSKDRQIQENAKTLLGMIPEAKNGTYQNTENKGALLGNYETFAMQLLSNPHIKDSYPEKDLQVIQKSVDLLKSIDPQVPQSKSESDTFTNPANPDNSIYRWYNTTYETKKLTATKPGETDPYIEITDGTDSFNDSQKFDIMLNGGSMKWEGIERVEYKIPWYADTETEITDRPAVDAYDDETRTILTQHSATNMGDALTSVLNKMAAATPNGDNLLATWGKESEDVDNYRKYKAIKDDYDMYQPDYEYVPSDNISATYYENMFKAIEAAGGGIGVSESQGKNTTWVESMIKNAKVILTTWDANENTLSRTSPSLHVDVKEISDDYKVAQAESEYEAEMAFINEKDTKIDNILSKLETERTSIKTEIDGIEKVMQDNVNKIFTVFS